MWPERSARTSALKSTATPTTMNMSARLNAGQASRSRKSVTLPEAHAVDQVRDAAAEDEAQPHGQHGMAPPGAREEPDHQAHRERGDRDHGARSAREEPEGDAGVLDVVDRERTEEVHSVADLDACGRRPASSAGRRRSPRPRSASSASHCAGPAASDRSADEIGRSAFAVDPTRTSTCGSRAGSLNRAPARACRRCRASRREPPRAAPRRSACRRRRRCHTSPPRFGRARPRSRR